MLYHHEDLSSCDQAWAFLEAHDFVLFDHNRHVWKSNPEGFSDFATEGGTKRNDKTIRAFAQIVQEKVYANPLLVTFAYGDDHEDSMELIKTLGIDSCVHWMPKSPRTLILAGLKKASLACGEFRKHWCGIGGTVYESLAMGTPVMTHTDGATANPSHPFFQAPLIECESQEEIFATLKAYASEPEHYKTVAHKGKAWFDEHLGIGLAKEYITLFEQLLTR